MSSNTEQPKTAEQIAQALADWSKKYPRKGIYSMNSKMDDELIAIEEDAKTWASTPPVTSVEENNIFSLRDEYVKETGDVGIKSIPKYADWLESKVIAPSQSVEEIKPGDILPYTNSASKIGWAEVKSIEETTAKNKLWFHGIDTKTKAKVWYPCNTSLSFLQAFKDYADLQCTNAMQHPAKDEGVKKVYDILLLIRRHGLIENEGYETIVRKLNEAIKILQPYITATPQKPSINVEDIESLINKHLDSLPYAGGYPSDWKETLAKYLSENMPAQPSSNVGEEMTSPADNHWFDHVLPRKKVLDMLEENMNAGLCREDQVRPAEEMVKETLSDIIEIVKTM